MLRAAVIGVGAIGRHHVRIYNQFEDVELVAVADTDEARRSILSIIWGLWPVCDRATVARSQTGHSIPRKIEKIPRRTSIARRYKVTPYTSYEEMLAKERLDELVSIAVPTMLHRDVALAAIEYGGHVLVEKPIAATVPEDMLSGIIRFTNGVVAGLHSGGHPRRAAGRDGHGRPVRPGAGEAAAGVRRARADVALPRTGANARLGTNDGHVAALRGRPTLNIGRDVCLNRRTI
ncbi:MAG: hypothetical protein CVU38_04475 [Chloroflexi bacterium HGW-Chloroflexi-1]|nr:MAG: hypothetical protein CVU38_04475 [Chloroflexi bacterium HGW-Chloroflexi-1]